VSAINLRPIIQTTNHLRSYQRTAPPTSQAPLLLVWQGASRVTRAQPLPPERQGGRSFHRRLGHPNRHRYPLLHQAWREEGEPDRCFELGIPPPSPTLLHLQIRLTFHQADAEEIKAGASADEFSFKLHGHKHKFEAPGERDSWLAAVKQVAEEAKAKKEEIVNSEGYKEALAKLSM
jgi:hypothetical protein